MRYANRVGNRTPKSEESSYREIFDESGKLIAVFFDFHTEATESGFLSNANTELQVAVMNKKIGANITSHYHPGFNRSLTSTQEVLIVISGVVIANLFDSDHKFFERIYLSGGMGLHLISGGHGFEIVEEAKMIEIKQGPYAGIRDKVLIPDKTN